MSLSLSQIGVPATVELTIFAAQGLAGGEPGLGFLQASIDANGHLQVLRTDGSTWDAGKVAPVVAEISASGSNAATGTLLTADVSIVIASSAGGVCVLPGSGSNLSRKVINLLTTAVVICVAAGSHVDTNAPGASVEVLGGSSVTFHSVDGVLWASS